MIEFEICGILDCRNWNLGCRALGTLWKLSPVVGRWCEKCGWPLSSREAGAEMVPWDFTSFGRELWWLGVLYHMLQHLVLCMGSLYAPPPSLPPNMWIWCWHPTEMNGQIHTTDVTSGPPWNQADLRAADKFRLFQVPLQPWGLEISLKQRLRTSDVITWLQAQEP